MGCSTGTTNIYISTNIGTITLETNKKSSRELVHLWWSMNKCQGERVTYSAPCTEHKEKITSRAIYTKIKCTENKEKGQLKVIQVQENKK